jgi:transposase
VKKPPKGLSQAAAAKRAGVSASSIFRWITAGKLETDPDGKIAPSSIDKIRKLREEEARAKETATTAERENEARLLAAQVAEREQRVKLRELELRQKSGEYVSRAEVVKDATETHTAICSRLRQIPSRVALAVESILARPDAPPLRAAAVEALISSEVEATIASVHSTFAGGAP